MFEPLPFSHQKSLFEWKMKSIFLRTSVESEVLNIGGAEWKLILKLLRDSSSNIYYFISFKKLKEGTIKETSIILTETYIENCNGTHVFPQKSVISYDDSSEKSIWWASFDDLHAERDRLVTDGILTFIITLTYESNQCHNRMDRGVSVQTSLPIDPILSLESLSFDMKHLLDECTFSDVILKCDDRSFAVHKVILCARSEVFSAMLRSNMSESRDGVITIVDIDPPVLDQLVQYMYTGNISDLCDEAAQKLYEASDKYAIKSLKKQCAEFMKENLNEKNVCDTLFIADAHCDVDLKESAISFLKSTHLLDDIWVKFLTHHPLLAEEIYSQIFTSQGSAE